MGGGLGPAVRPRIVVWGRIAGSRSGCRLLAGLGAVELLRGGHLPGADPVEFSSWGRLVLVWRRLLGRHLVRRHLLGWHLLKRHLLGPHLLIRHLLGLYLLSRRLGNRHVLSRLRLR